MDPLRELLQAHIASQLGDKGRAVELMRDRTGVNVKAGRAVPYSDLFSLAQERFQIVTISEGLLKQKPILAPSNFTVPIVYP